MICLAVSSAAIVGLVGFNLQQHLSGGGASADSFLVVVHSIFSMTDFPLIAAWIGSIVNVFCCGWMSSSSGSEASGQIEPGSTEAVTSAPVS